MPSGSFARTAQLWAARIASRSPTTVGLMPSHSRALPGRSGRPVHDHDVGYAAPQFQDNRIVALVSPYEISPLIGWLAAHPVFTLEALCVLRAPDQAGEFGSVQALAELPVVAEGQAATAAYLADIVLVGERLDLMTCRMIVSVVNRALDGAIVCRLAEFLAAPEPARSRNPGSALTSDLVATLDRRSNGRRLKRSFDLVVGTLAAILSAPLVALIAVLIKLDTSGPVFFVQERLGRLERPFRCIKLRTMCDNAERLTGPVWASASDPRITRVGRVLRKTRLDELPQLLNVLRGEMSLVGPRPIRKHFADQLAQDIPFYRLRFLERPGLTGWSQVNSKYVSTFLEQVTKFRFECEYLTRQSLLFDIYIILRTGIVVLSGKGA